MALRDWISNYSSPATATVATPATLELSGAVTVATVATVASAEKDEKDSRGLTDVIDGLHPCILCGGHFFNEGSRGGYFCVDCQPLQGIVISNRVVRGITPRKPKKEYVYYEPSSTAPKKDKRRPTAVALEWLLKNRQELDDAGWTRAELYRRNKSKIGLAWLKLWEEAFSRAYLHEDGTIEFECSMNGRDYFQTARPKKQTQIEGRK
jgi:hypothetical protein